MNLYLVERTDNIGYDEYDSFICAADNEQEARNTSPSDYYILKDNDWYFIFADGSEMKKESRDDWVDPMSLWTLDIRKVGTADETLPRGVVLASFNAG